MPFDGTNFDQQDPVLTVLRRALAVLRERGWCQGQTRDSGGRVCIYGAVREAGYTGNWRDLGLPWPADTNDFVMQTQADAEAWLEEHIRFRVAQVQTAGAQA